MANTNEKTVELHELTGRMQTFNLTHAHGATRQMFGRAGGEVRVSVPDSITFLANEKKTGLSPFIASAPEVKNAIASGKLALVKPPKPAKVEAPVVAPAAPVVEAPVVEAAPEPTPGPEPVKAIEKAAPVSDRSDTHGGRKSRA